MPDIVKKDCRIRFTQDVEAALITRFDPGDITIISTAVIKALNNYEITDRCTDLIVLDDINEKILKRYAACLLVNGKSQKTVYQYVRSCRKLSDMIGKPYVEIQSYDVWLFLANEMERGLSASSRENTRSNLSAFFRWMTMEKIISDNPMLSIQPIKCPEKVKKPFSDIEIDLLRSACKKPKERALIEVLLTTGIRVDECSKMRVDDINKETCAVHVRHGKGNKERITYTTPVAMRHILAYVYSRKENGDLLFYNKDHSQISTDGIRHILNTIASRAGISGVHPHRFRRTFATNLYRRGMDVQEIQRLMGHANINTTMTYIVVEDTRVSASYKRCIA